MPERGEGVKARNMVQCGLFAAVLTVCAWIAVPLGHIAVTLQTFGVFLTLGLLGGKRGSATIGVYLLLGLLGAPVFSGFRGGASALLGATGGYLFGFLGAGLVYWLVTALVRKPIAQPLGMAAGLLLCYLIGSVWFSLVYLPGTDIWAAAVTCVVPYVIPDLLKLALAWFLTRRLHRFV